jgi:hypothetical protein
VLKERRCSLLGRRKERATKTRSSTDLLTGQPKA